MTLDGAELTLRPPSWGVGVMAHSTPPTPCRGGHLRSTNYTVSLVSRSPGSHRRCASSLVEAHGVISSLALPSLLFVLSSAPFAQSRIPPARFALLVARHPPTRPPSSARSPPLGSTPFRFAIESQPMSRSELRLL